MIKSFAAHCVVISLLAPLVTLGAESKSNLIGGTADLNKEYPEVVYISNYFSACSATLIGPRVLLTAAHCMADGTWIYSKHQNLPFRGQCHHATDGVDFALCMLTDDLDVAYASVSDVPVELGQSIVLTGYGCTIKGGGGGNDGILRTGNATVEELPSNDFKHVVLKGEFYTRGDVALCSGDSGGPAFHSKEKPHQLVGVNSRGDLKEWSLMVPMFTESNRRVIENFAATHNVEVCGINGDCD